jgi:catalase
MFYNSQSEPEKAHIVDALRFELGKVEILPIRERMVMHLAHVDRTLATQVAEGLGLKVPAKLEPPVNMSVPADGDPKDFQPRRAAGKTVDRSPALSMANTVKDSIKTRKVAVLAADGVDDTALNSMKKALTTAGAQAKIIAPRLGSLKTAKGGTVKIDFSLLTAGSVLFDAVYVPGGKSSVEALKADARAIHFVDEAFKHCKTIGATAEGAELLRASRAGVADEGVIVNKDAQAFIKAMTGHRHWTRQRKDDVPA